MSYRQVVRHLEQILNGCGDPVRFTPTGRKMLDQSTQQMALEVMSVDLQRINDCFKLPRPCRPTPTTAQAATP